MKSELIESTLNEMRHKLGKTDVNEMPLGSLLHNEQWGDLESKAFAAVAKKIDIKWKIQRGKLPIDEPWVSASAILLYRQ